jgi:general secretion pathway protein F
MPAFNYIGLDGRGKQVKGMRDAENPRTLRSSLRREGIFVTEVNETRKKVVRGEGLKREVDIKGVFDRVKTQDVAILTRQLATLLKAGITLAEALNDLTEQAVSEKLGRALADVRTKVVEGTALADALAAHPAIFPTLYINMVRAGEVAGDLDTVLRRLADFMDGQVRLRAAISGAMTYPIVMLFVGGGLMTLLMTTVVPNISQIFADSGRALPWYTNLVIFISEITGDYWWLIGMMLTGGSIGFSKWKASASGKPVWDRFLLRLWLVGPLVKMAAMARFSRTLGTMLTAGVPMLKALEIVRAIVGNHALATVIGKAASLVREGETLATPLGRSEFFPPMVTRMIAVGEKSGQLETMLETVADTYETEVEMKLNRLTRLLEPLFILLMGFGVGFVVFSILMPIWEMNEMVG